MYHQEEENKTINCNIRECSKFHPVGKGEAAYPDTENPSSIHVFRKMLFHTFIRCFEVQVLNI